MCVKNTIIQVLKHLQYFLKFTKEIAPKKFENYFTVGLVFFYVRVQQNVSI